MAQVYKKKIELKIVIPTIWDQGPPSFRNKIAKMCYLYRRTGLACRGECCGGRRGGCHGITCGMPSQPPRRAMESYAMRWDAVGMPWYAMGGTMAMYHGNAMACHE